MPPRVLTLPSHPPDADGRRAPRGAQGPFGTRICAGDDRAEAAPGRRPRRLCAVRVLPRTNAGLPQAEAAA
jgi:hypothetical protein